MSLCVREGIPAIVVLITVQLSPLFVIISVVHTAPLTLSYNTQDDAYHEDYITFTTRINLLHKEQCID
jgi:hypothetical protein